MLDIVSGINSSTALWYASRATGVVALLLMTAVVLLGLLVTRQGRLPGLPRFAVTGLHRNLSLVAVVFVVLHVLTAVADSYVRITSSTDLRHGWFFLLGVACALLVIAAVIWRVSAASRDVPRAERVGLLMSAVHERIGRR